MKLKTLQIVAKKGNSKSKKEVSGKQSIKAMLKTCKRDKTNLNKACFHEKNIWKEKW